MRNKEKLFSVTKKDFEVQTFRCSGSGGQHVNKTSSGVRIIHRPSGATGESCEERKQSQNKKTAFKRLVKSVKFRRWINLRVMEIVEGKTIEEKVEESMCPENLKVEVRTERGWEEISNKEE